MNHDDNHQSAERTQNGSRRELSEDVLRILMSGHGLPPWYDEENYGDHDDLDEPDDDAGGHHDHDQS